MCQHIESEAQSQLQICLNQDCEAKNRICCPKCFLLNHCHETFEVTDFGQLAGSLKPYMSVAMARHKAMEELNRVHQMRCYEALSMLDESKKVIKQRLDCLFHEKESDAIIDLYNLQINDYSSLMSIRERVSKQLADQDELARTERCLIGETGLIELRLSKPIQSLYRDLEFDEKVYEVYGRKAYIEDKEMFKEFEVLSLPRKLAKIVREKVKGAQIQQTEDKESVSTPEPQMIDQKDSSTPINGESNSGGVWPQEDESSLAKACSTMSTVSVSFNSVEQASELIGNYSGSSSLRIHFNFSFQNPANYAILQKTIEQIGDFNDLTALSIHLLNDFPEQLWQVLDERLSQLPRLSYLQLVTTAPDDLHYFLQLTKISEKLKQMCIESKPPCLQIIYFKSPI